MVYPNRFPASLRKIALEDTFGRTATHKVSIGGQGVMLQVAVGWLGHDQGMGNATCWGGNSLSH